MNLKIALAGAAFALAQFGFADNGWIVASCGDGKSDVSDALQKLIDENPNRTIYFPDGVYILAKPIATPADPRKSVYLQLSNYAIIRAAPGWNSPEALVRLGGKDPYNSITIPGSNYSITGGIIDGSGVANGISIDSGRETAVRTVSIKNTQIGLHIKRGANSGSSDCDIHDVNIVGNKKKDSIGVLVEGWDNTFTNMRIAGVHTGMLIKTSGNSFRNIHPLYTCGWNDYAGSTAFDLVSGENWFWYCYNDQFAIGFHLHTSGVSYLDHCFNYWYSKERDSHTCIKADKKFNAIVTNLRAGFRWKETINTVLEVKEEGGNGVIQNLVANPSELTGPDKSFEKYLQGKLIH